MDSTSGGQTNGLPWLRIDFAATSIAWGVFILSWFLIILEVSGLSIFAMGCLVVGLTHTISGMIYVTDWRGSLTQDERYARYARNRLIIGWLKLSIGLGGLLCAILFLVIA